jgi:hypothetical protein
MRRTSLHGVFGSGQDKDLRQGAHFKKSLVLALMICR